MTAPPRAPTPKPSPADLGAGESLLLSWDELGAFVRTMDPNTQLELTRWPADWTLRLRPPEEA